MKYIQRLEKRNEFYLPLIDKYENGIVNCSCKIPLSFYSKYKRLFEESKSYISLFKLMDIDKYYQKNSFQSDEYYTKAGDNLSEYYSIDEELYWIDTEWNKIDFEIVVVESLFSIVIRILKLAKDIYPHNKEIYDKSLVKYKEAFVELKRIGSITYNKDTVKYKRVYLPDSWFILPNKTLYNTGNGHKGTSLVYDFENVVVKHFVKGKNLNGLSSSYYDLAKKIKKDGFTESQFRNYLNLCYSPVYTDLSHEIPTSHEKNTLDHIVGVVMAKSYFYHFFENMQNNCLDPVKELDKIKRMTNNDLVDILVRCCGFHKVESKVNKTITTSDVNYEKEFLEYIDKGWNIKFIPPIVVRKDLGIVSLLDVESSLVKRYIK